MSVAVNTMTSVLQHTYGDDPEAVLGVGSAPIPTPGPGEVLVQVGASSVDRGTWHLMAGVPTVARLALGLRRPTRLNPGLNVAGTVAALGDGVTGFAVGDAVFGTAPSAFAEYAVAKATRLAAAPAGLEVSAVSTIPVSGLTALQAIRDQARVQPGQRVLVIGAAGGVGSFTVQVAKAAGAEVTGVCRAARAGFVRSLGADHVDEDLPTGPFDAIIQTARHRPLRELRGVLAECGTLVLVGSETSGRLLGGLDKAFGAHLASMFSRQRLGTFVSGENAADLDELRRMVEAGQVRPAVDTVYPLAEVAAAVRHLQNGGVRGKIAVTI